ncbi:MAG TPA: hypothetical protein VKR58_14360 [Aquella sp.]|nr:hypothetical protein [Aquella sp.]
MATCSGGSPELSMFLIIYCSLCWLPSSFPSCVEATTTIISGQIHNTLLLYPIMVDSQNPVEVAGAYVRNLIPADL